MTEPLNEPWVGMEGEPWLHVYGQYMWHSPATIRGTAAGLQALRRAIDAALAGEEGRANVVATDGEGYDVMVTMVNLVSAVGTPEYVIHAEDSARQREHDRAIRNDIYKLGYPQKPAPPAIITAQDLVRAMEATEWQRGQIQGFDAPDAHVLYIRDCLLPRDDQRVWERPYSRDADYAGAHADMMREISVRGYQKALDWLTAERDKPAA